MLRLPSLTTALFAVLTMIASPAALASPMTPSGAPGDNGTREAVPADENGLNDTLATAGIITFDTISHAIVGGTPEVKFIKGIIGPAQLSPFDLDFDTFQFASLGGAFVATTDNGETLFADTVLRLFNGSGGLIAQNDDIDPIAGNLRSRIALDLAPGLYFLDIRGFGSSHVGAYRIDLEGAIAIDAPVSEPQALGLIGMGVALFAVARRRRAGRA